MYMSIASNHVDELLTIWPKYAIIWPDLPSTTKRKQTNGTHPLSQLRDWSGSDIGSFRWLLHPQILWGDPFFRPCHSGRSGGRSPQPDLQSPKQQDHLLHQQESRPCLYCVVTG